MHVKCVLSLNPVLDVCGGDTESYLVIFFKGTGCRTEAGIKVLMQYCAFNCNSFEVRADPCLCVMYGKQDRISMGMQVQPGVPDVGRKERDTLVFGLTLRVIQGQATFLVFAVIYAL